MSKYRNRVSQKSYNNNQYILTRHAKERLIERGISISSFLNRDLNYTCISTMIKGKGNTTIRYTKTGLKIVMSGNTVITVCKTSHQQKTKDVFKQNKIK